MKNFLMLGIICLGILIPLACADNNNNPTKPKAPLTGGTVTVTGTVTVSIFTTTNTPTPTGTVFTATPTITGTVFTPTNTTTPVLSPTPPYDFDTGTSAEPNGMYYDKNGKVLYVTTGEYRVNGDVTMFEAYSVIGYNLSGGVQGNTYVIGYPTPGADPPWQGTTLVATYPQGFAYTPWNGGHYAMLDSSAAGSATLFEGCNGFLLGQVPVGDSQFPTYTAVGYGGSPFIAPRAVAGDSQGNFYVADTGNGYIDEFDSYCRTGPPPNPDWEHRWNGISSGTPFIKPVAVVVDDFDNVYVGDSGYTPSIVQEYSSGGTTILGSWKLQPNCIINGLAVDSLGDFYVSDIYGAATTAGGNVEEYHINSFNSATLVREWGDPHGVHEFQPFYPSCIALVQPSGVPVVPSFIIVGDTNNDLLNVFGP